MPSRLRGKKAKAQEDEVNSAEGATEGVVGRALAIRPPRSKLALAGAGFVAATVALLAAVLARRRRD